jgi:hypothetical protein
MLALEASFLALIRSAASPVSGVGSKNPGANTKVPVIEVPGETPTSQLVMVAMPEEVTVEEPKIANCFSAVSVGAVWASTG